MLVDVAKEHGLFIIGDEAYREFVYAGEPLQSLGEFADAAENVVVIDTVSKRFSACGARVGCIISRNKELLSQAMKYCQARLSVATLDQIASAAFYDVDGTLIRINLREAEVPRHHAGALSLPLRASEAMAGIVAAL